MPTLFNKPPLIEAIAEVRWGEQVISGDERKQAFAHQANEAFYSSLSAATPSVGFPQMERLVPPGFAVAPGSVALRFRSGREGANNLLQAGPGVFTVNALPPYLGWTDFEPTLKQGMELMLKCRPLAEQSLPLSASLRYMNGFSAREFWPGESGAVKFAESLGFSLRLPEAMKRIGDFSEASNFAFQLRLPAKNGIKAVASWQEAVANGEQVSLLDLHFLSAEPVVPTIEGVMSFMRQAQEINHETFMALIKDFASKFDPQEN